MTRFDHPAVADIKHDPDPLLTRMMNLMWRYDKDPSVDDLVDVVNEAAAEIERLREQLADAHDMINNMTEHLYRIHRTIQEARNDPS